jgi:hypothetical protein
MVVYVSAAYTSHRDILLTAKTDGSKRIQARFSPQANFESSTVSLWARRTIFLGRAKRSNCLVIAAGWVKPAILSCHALPRAVLFIAKGGSTDGGCWFLCKPRNDQTIQSACFWQIQYERPTITASNTGRRYEAS